MTPYIWYEKYRPHSLEEMDLPTSVYNRLNSYIKDQNIPHLLFYGPAGGGKSTVAKILMDKIPNQSLRLNASSDRSMEIMRTQVVPFAYSQPIPGKIKIVFMDEADGLLKASQEQLRGAIEAGQKTCRFIFALNYPERIQNPILSRFQKIKFDTVGRGSLIKHLTKILSTEKIKFAIKDLNTIYDSYFPDVRTIVNALQICSLDGVLDLVHLQDVDESASYMDISGAILEGNLRRIREIVAGNYTFQGNYRHLFDQFIFSVPEDVRPSVAVTISEAMYRDNLVVDKEINFSSLCVELMHILEVKSIQW